MTPKPKYSVAELEMLARGPVDGTDVELFKEVASIYDSVDPVPAGLTDRIKFGITLDALEAEVAELQRSGGLAGVRGDTTDVQSITFTSSTMTTMVTITPLSAEHVRIDGWIAPGAGVAIEVRTGDGETVGTVADDDGRFTLTAVPRGLAQFVLRNAAEPSKPLVVTPSLQL